MMGVKERKLDLERRVKKCKKIFLISFLFDIILILFLVFLNEKILLINELIVKILISILLSMSFLIKYIVIIGGFITRIKIKR
ncbi:MAG: hypothetical protein ACFFDK_19215, partial [Promethearchaeota archaeon]